MRKWWKHIHSWPNTQMASNHSTFKWIRWSQGCPRRVFSTFSTMWWMRNFNFKLPGYCTYNFDQGWKEISSIRNTIRSGSEWKRKSFNTSILLSGSFCSLKATKEPNVFAQRQISLINDRIVCVWYKCYSDHSLSLMNLGNCYLRYREKIILPRFEVVCPNYNCLSLSFLELSLSILSYYLN